MKCVLAYLVKFLGDEVMRGLGAVWSTRDGD